MSIDTPERILARHMLHAELKALACPKKAQGLRELAVLPVQSEAAVRAIVKALTGELPADFLAAAAAAAPAVRVVGVDEGEK